MNKLFKLMVAAGILYSILLMGVYYAAHHAPSRGPEEFMYTQEECVDACLYAFRNCPC